MGTPPPSTIDPQESTPTLDADLGVHVSVDADGQTVWHDPTTDREYHLDPDSGHMVWDDPATGDREYRDADTGDVLVDEPAVDVAPAALVDEVAVTVPVPPGEARAIAEEYAAMFGLAELGAPADVQERLVDLLTEAAQDGELTMWEMIEAMDQAMEGDMAPLETSVAEMTRERDVLTVLNIEGEGTGAFRVHVTDGEVELESLRTQATYATDSERFERAWRSTGARVIEITGPAPVHEEAAVEEQLAVDGVARADEGGSGSDTGRNLLIGGAVVLPIAGAAAYVATRKIR